MVCASEIAIVLDGSCHGGGGSCPFSVKWGTGGKRGNGKGESGMEREREVEGRWKGAWEGKWSLYPLLQNPVYATSAGFTLQCLRKKEKNELWWAVHMYCRLFVTNSLGCVSVKYWQNRVISDQNVTKIKGVTFLPRDAGWAWLWDCMLFVCLSVCPSVTFRYCDYIGWNTSKIISRQNSLRSLLTFTPTWAILCKGNWFRPVQESRAVAENRAMPL